MCSVSMIGDHYNDKFRSQYPGPLSYIGFVNRSEFDKLKADVDEMKALLKRAKAYDEANGEPDCEMAEKMAVLRRMAKLVGVDLDDVLGKK